MLRVARGVVGAVDGRAVAEAGGRKRRGLWYEIAEASASCVVCEAVAEAGLKAEAHVGIKLCLSMCGHHQPRNT